MPITFCPDPTSRFGVNVPESPDPVFTTETLPLSSCTMVPPCSWLLPPGKLSFQSLPNVSLTFFGMVIVFGASVHVFGVVVGSPEQEAVAELAGVPPAPDVGSVVFFPSLTVRSSLVAGDYVIEPRPCLLFQSLGSGGRVDDLLIL